MRRSAPFIPLALALAASLAACGTRTVPRAEIEKQAQSYFDGVARRSGQARFPDIRCPDDLEAEKGKTVRCSAPVKGGTLGITVTITKVDGHRAAFSFKPGRVTR